MSTARHHSANKVRVECDWFLTQRLSHKTQLNSTNHPPESEWLTSVKKLMLIHTPDFFNILDRSAHQPVSDSIPDQWASQVRQKEASAACSFRATWSDCSTTPSPQIKPTINRQTTKRISTTAASHRPAPLWVMAGQVSPSPNSKR